MFFTYCLKKSAGSCSAQNAGKNTQGISVGRIQGTTADGNFQVALFNVFEPMHEFRSVGHFRFCFRQNSNHSFKVRFKIIFHQLVQLCKVKVARNGNDCVGWNVMFFLVIFDTMSVTVFYVVGQTENSLP